MPWVTLPNYCALVAESGAVGLIVTAYLQALLPKAFKILLAEAAVALFLAMFDRRPLLGSWCAAGTELKSTIRVAAATDGSA